MDPLITKHENYPLVTVAVSNLLQFLIYGCGFIIMYQTGIIISGVYLLYIFFLELRLVKNHCVDCYYYGKICGFGRGKITSLFFGRGDSTKFCACDMTFKDMIPDILVSLIPVLTAIVLMIIKFEITILITTIVLIVLTTLGNGYIRGNLTCRFCIQKDKGCPADRLFNKQV